MEENAIDQVNSEREIYVFYMIIAIYQVGGKQLHVGWFLLKHFTITNFVCNHDDLPAILLSMWLCTKNIL